LLIQAACGYNGTHAAESLKPQGAKPLDLAQFESLEQAIEKADRIAARYADVGELGMQNRNLTLLTVFFMSALARA
jgi:hypothetical protein